MHYKFIAVFDDFVNFGWSTVFALNFYHQKKQKPDSVTMETLDIFWFKLAFSLYTNGLTDRAMKKRTK